MHPRSCWLLMAVLLVAVESLESPPNIHDAEYGFNVLLGRPPPEQRTSQVGSRIFTFSGSTRSSGVGGYIQYRQIEDMTTSETCNWNGISRQVSFATSYETLESQSSSSSHGYDQQTSIGVTLPAGPAEVSAETSIRNALIFGNSKTSEKQRIEKESGYTYTFDATASRTLYGIEIDYDSFESGDYTGEFRDSCRALGHEPSRNQVIGFFQEVGTHGLRRVEFGQKCTSSVFMEGGSTMSGYYKVNEEVRSKEFAMLWWTSSTEDIESDTTDYSASADISYSYANKYCVGEMEFDSSCGGLKGTRGNDSPGIVAWTYKPIWEMNVPDLFHSAKTNMKRVFEDIMRAGADCARNYCSNRGACAPNPNPWVSKSQAIASSPFYSSFWDRHKCFCDEMRTGPSCSETRSIEVDFPPKFPTHYQNEYDGDMLVYGSDDRGDPAPLCGMESKHDNRAEDRRFKWATCQVKEEKFRKIGDNALGLPWWFWLFQNSLASATSYDATWTRECGDNSVLVLVLSSHNNRAEDRQFLFGCMAFPLTMVSQCKWTDYVNDYDGDVYFTCPVGQVLGGIGSTHSNAAEDRKFKFKCCIMQASHDA